MRFFILLFSLFSICTLTTFAAEHTTKIQVQTDLYSEPDKSSNIIKKISPNTNVVIQQRKGNWCQIKIENQPDTGWVRSYFVQTQSNANWLTRMTKFLRGDYPSQSTAIATIGIRGLGPGDVKKASPDLKELSKLDNYKLNISDGISYASNASLKSQEIAYLEPMNNEDGKKTILDKSAKNLGKVADGVGKSLGGAVKGLKGLFGKKKDDN